MGLSLSAACCIISLRPHDCLAWRVAESRNTILRLLRLDFWCRLYPDCRFLGIMRDPIDVLRSCAGLAR
jgi:hypothetical protein